MTLLEVAYFLSNVQLSNADYNRLINIIKEKKREDLFETSFANIKEDLFTLLEQEDQNGR